MVKILKKKLFALGVLVALSLSPLASISFMNNHTPLSQNTTLPTTVKAQEQEGIVTGKDGSLEITMPAQPAGANPLNTPGLYASEVVERIFDRPTVTNPRKPYDYTPTEERWIPNMLESYHHEILTNHTVTLRNGTSSADIPGWGGTLGEPVNMSKWTLKIRDFKWQDGTPVSVKDFIFSYQFEKWVSYYGVSSNLDQYYGPTNMGYVTAKKINDTALEVYTTRTGFYNSKLPLDVLILPKHIYENAEAWTDTNIETLGGAKFSMDNWWDPGWGVDVATCTGYTAQGPSDPVLTGSGMWVPTFWDAATAVDTKLFRYKRYSGYYWNPYDDQGNIIEGREWIPTEGNYDRIYNYSDPYLWGPYAKTFEYKVIQTQDARWRAWAQEKVDTVGGRILIDHLSTIQEGGYPVIMATDNDIQGGFSIQCSKTYLTRHQKFRKALAYAIDKGKIISINRRGYGQPVDHMVSPAYGDTWYWEPQTSLADPLTDKARSMIADNLDNVDDTGDRYLKGPKDASWTDDEGNIQVELQYPGANSPIERKTARAKQQDLQAAGIKVKMVSMTWSQVVGHLVTGTFQLSQHGWSMGALPPVDLPANFSTFGQTTYHWDHGAKYYNLVKTFLNARKQSVAGKACKEASKILYNNQPYLAVYSPKTVATYRTEKWAGVITAPRSGGIWGGEHSYRKFARVISRPGETAEGFSRAQKSTVSSTMDVTGALKETNPEANGDIASIKLDDKNLVYKTLRNTTPEGPGRDLVLYTYSYSIDTTNLENGWHMLHVQGFLTTGDPFGEWWLKFYVDNPVPITERTLPMAAISGCIGAVVVGAIVYVLMRRKKPPKE